MFERTRQFLSGLLRRSVLASPGTAMYGQSLAGVPVTPQSALALSSVYRAIDCIASDIGGLPGGVYRRLARGGVKPMYKDPRFHLWHTAPNTTQNAVVFKTHALGHVLGWGNCYIEIVRNYDGSAKELQLLSPSQTKPRLDDKGKLYYQLENGKRLLPENVIHFAGLGYDGLQGYSVIKIHANEIGAGMAMGQFGAAFFGNSAVPFGILTTDKPMGEGAVNSLRASLNRRHQGPQNAANMMILPPGLKYTPGTIPLEQAQYIASRQFSVLEVARMYGLPPHKLGDFSQAHHSSVEESNLEYFTTTLTNWLGRIECELNLKLFFEAERGTLFMRHDMAGLLRGNMAARAGYYTSGIAGGWFDVNTILGMENMNPITEAEGGFVRFAPANLLPLAEFEKRRQAALAPAVVAPDPQLDPAPGIPATDPLTEPEPDEPDEPGDTDPDATDEPLPDDAITPQAAA